MRQYSACRYLRARICRPARQAVVRKERLELSRLPHWLLKPARLPIPPLSHPLHPIILQTLPCIIAASPRTTVKPAYPPRNRSGFWHACTAHICPAPCIGSDRRGGAGLARAHPAVPVVRARIRKCHEPHGARTRYPRVPGSLSHVRLSCMARDRLRGRQPPVLGQCGQGLRGRNPGHDTGGHRAACWCATGWWTRSGTGLQAVSPCCWPLHSSQGVL